MTFNLRSLFRAFAGRFGNRKPQAQGQAQAQAQAPTQPRPLPPVLSLEDHPEVKPHLPVYCPQCGFRLHSQAERELRVCAECATRRAPMTKAERRAKAARLRERVTIET